LWFEKLARKKHDGDLGGSGRIMLNRSWCNRLEMHELQVWRKLVN
jgi:hypothetical protein